ncbi:hypothetical protein ScPMuIL_013656 [Solemya velum]
MNEKIFGYFSDLNPIAKRIIQQQEQLKCLYGSDWDKLDWGQQDELIDDFIVDTEIREKYRTVTKTQSYPSSFPRLVLQTGEKIVVDTEKDLWTWRDEHSAPFSWKTKSQQDLTLLDLEPGNLCQPSPTKSAKSCNRSTDEDSETFSATREFEYKEGSIWNSPFLQGTRKPASISSVYSAGSATSLRSRESPQKKPSKHIQNVNLAFKESSEDVRKNKTIIEPATPDRTALKQELELKLSRTAEKSTQKSGKSPKKSKSPLKSKLPLSAHLSKSSHGESLTSLIKEPNGENKNNGRPDVGQDNPAVAGCEWSSFVGEDSTGSSASSPSHALLREPQDMTINRSPSEDEEGEENSMPKTRNGGYEKVELQVETTEEHSDAASTWIQKQKKLVVTRNQQRLLAP